MFKEEYAKLASVGESKTKLLRNNPVGYLMMSLIAGGYMSFGVFLCFTAGGALSDNPFSKLVMGGSFAVALSLVIMAGGELFTGNNLCITAAMTKKTVSLPEALKLWVFCWIGNLIGSVFLAWLFNLTGLYTGATLITVTNAAATKMTAGFVPLLTRAILCNMLVCLVRDTAEVRIRQTHNGILVHFRFLYDRF